ncbi:polypeptide n-acetylgalactosaminyltransferase-like 6 [Limosa lapponica baueri]|uniref:Polypeptide n-acetylgalactosaminyltransferase-like 6 n=1 Tax=Limosa lapponica baueri TaxID=1758121 RepID=A0A2I0TLT4_LIMLA|nr:polypeptide n-acetylgalactosaminyltransferase-like 6 [Limosa lapponica baueri]
MKRKQKRFLQMTLLFTAALIFLPDIGLWALLREKHLVKPPEPAEPQLSITEVSPLKYGKLVNETRRMEDALLLQEDVRDSFLI